MSLVLEKPGLYFDVSAADYHRDPCPTASLSRGAAVTLLTKSPLHCFLEHPKLGGGGALGESTAEMDFGQVGHKLLLGRGADIQVGEWDDWRTNAAKDWRKEVRAAGGIPILQKVQDRAFAFETGARKELQRLGFDSQFNAALPEVVAVWKEDGCFLRAMFDKLWLNGPTPETSTSAIIFDVKVTESAAPEACTRQINNMGYDLQAHHYPRGLTKLFPHLAGRTKFILLFFENSAPFSLTPMELDGEWTMLAERAWERAFAKWKECLATNIWPSYTDKILRASPPAWRVNAELAKEFANQ